MTSAAGGWVAIERIGESHGVLEIDSFFYFLIQAE